MYTPLPAGARQGLLPNFTLPAGFKVGELPPGYSQPLLSGCTDSFYVFNTVVLGGVGSPLV